MCSLGKSIVLALVPLFALRVASVGAETPQPPAGDRLFHKPGLIYFWALNDACAEATIDRFVGAFAKGGISAVCLHPRPGLLKPYGGDAWFEFIKQTVDRCAAHGLDVWLYDEDPWPSGNCGGWMTADHPEYRAMDIRRTAWRQAGRVSDPFSAAADNATRLLMNLRGTPAQITVDGRSVVLAPGEIHVAKPER